jgi:hypothetical protein
VAGLADAELARTLLNDLFGPQTAENSSERHLQFLYDIIAPLEDEAWTISEADLRIWNDMYEAAQWIWLTASPALLSLTSPSRPVASPRAPIHPPSV